MSSRGPETLYCAERENRQRSATFTPGYGPQLQLQVVTGGKANPVIFGSEALDVQKDAQY